MCIGFLLPRVCFGQARRQNACRCCLCNCYELTPLGGNAKGETVAGADLRTKDEGGSVECTEAGGELCA